MTEHVFDAAAGQWVTPDLLRYRRARAPVPRAEPSVPEPADPDRRAALREVRATRDLLRAMAAQARP
jgi:hypothetical protein